ncbi:hypothetical protein BH11BAC2_BH11BAC2_18440 [soil metagenome]
MLSKIFFLLTNNILVNNVLIFTGLDKYVLSRMAIYRRISIDVNQSPEQMAGFSNRPEVEEALSKAHQDLKQTVKQYLKNGDRILDIGCGAGAYLKDLSIDYHTTGIDLNKDMIEAGRKNVPNSTFIFDDFLKYQFNQRFNLIYTVSVLEFIPPSALANFIKKVTSLLEPGGVFFLHYPHALRRIDTYYPDLYYIEYSPQRIEETVSQYLKIHKHEHAIDGRKVGRFDTKPYTPGTRTFKNGYLLIAGNTL